jgi:tetratricopeptide (TPR) repeat protein
VLLKLYAEPDPAALMVWFGIYLLLFGASIVAFALRLRTKPRHDDSLNPFADGITFGRMARGLFRMTEFVATAAVAAAIIALLYVFICSMNRQTIDIGTISVPKAWEKQGYTSAVAAIRLRDAINRIVRDADSHSPAPSFAGAEPEITIHEVWFKPEAIAGWLGTWLGRRQPQDVSGEITSDGCQARMRLRYNGDPLPSSEHPSSFSVCKEADAVKTPPAAAALDLEKANDQFYPAAGDILRRSAPYLIAAACQPYHLTESAEIVDLIIGAHQPHQGYGDVTWAYNIRGLNNERRERLRLGAKFDLTDKKLLADFDRSLDIDPYFGGEGNKFGILIVAAQHLRNTGKDDYAKDFWRQALESLLSDIHNAPRDPELRATRAELMYEADAHDRHVKGQLQLAAMLGRKAIGRDPDNPWNYVSTGAALFSFSEYHRGLVSEYDERARKELDEAEGVSEGVEEGSAETDDLLTQAEKNYAGRTTRGKSAETDDLLTQAEDDLDEAGEANEGTQKELVEAKDLFTQATELNPSGFEAHLYLAAVLFQASRGDENETCAGERKTWRCEIQRAYDLDPCNWYFDESQKDNLRVSLTDRGIVDTVAAAKMYFKTQPLRCPERDLSPAIYLSLQDEKRPLCPGVDHDPRK